MKRYAFSRMSGTSEILAIKILACYNWWMADKQNHHYSIVYKKGNNYEYHGYDLWAGLCTGRIFSWSLDLLVSSEEYPYHE
jgi:hypothetical protein